MMILINFIYANAPLFHVMTSSRSFFKEDTNSSCVLDLSFAVYSRATPHRPGYLFFHRWCRPWGPPRMVSFLMQISRLKLPGMPRIGTRYLRVSHPESGSAPFCGFSRHTARRSRACCYARVWKSISISGKQVKRAAFPFRHREREGKIPRSRFTI